MNSAAVITLNDASVFFSKSTVLVIHFFVIIFVRTSLTGSRHHKLTDKRINQHRTYIILILNSFLDSLKKNNLNAVTFATASVLLLAQERTNLFSVFHHVPRRKVFPF